MNIYNTFLLILNLVLLVRLVTGSGL